MEKTVQFSYHNRECTVLCPERPAQGRPWVWRAEFLYAFNFLDLALLEKGWHIAYCDMQNMYGCPESVAVMKQFHDEVVQRFQLCPGAAIFGFSRGGLYGFNYTVLHPQDVSLLYLDAPVLDILSWPGGYGSSEGSPEDWARCKAQYGITEAQAKAFRGSPKFRLEALLHTGVPVLLVAGDADVTVPYPENGLLLEQALKNAPNPPPYKVVVKPGCDHHPHSLEDPTELAAFVTAHAL